MADAYGTIVVCGDYRGDLDKVVDALNQLGGLNADGVQFVNSKGAIWLNNYHVQYPTVYPDRDSMIFKDGREVFFDEANEQLIDEWEAGGAECGGEPYDLFRLSRMISQHLTYGTIEFVAVAHEKSRDAYFERLLIRSDGYAERTHHCAHWETGSRSVADCYVPDNLQMAA